MNAFYSGGEQIESRSCCRLSWVIYWFS